MYNELKKLRMEQKIAKKITRDCLRSMANGDTVTVECQDGYDLDSQKNNAYAMQKMECCRFTCKVDGLTLSVTRHDNDTADV